MENKEELTKKDLLYCELELTCPEKYLEQVGFRKCGKTYKKYFPLYQYATYYKPTNMAKKKKQKMNLITLVVSITFISEHSEIEIEVMDNSNVQLYYPFYNPPATKNDVLDIVDKKFIQYMSELFGQEVFKIK